jgi:hypothetical protein
MPKKISILIILFFLFLAACGVSKSDEQIAVVEQYFQYWNSEDVDGIIAMLADHPEIEVDLGEIQTDKEQIRSTFEKLFERVDFQIEVSDFNVDGNAVTYNYQIFVGDTLNEQGRSQAIIENGKIKSEKYIGSYIP